MRVKVSLFLLFLVMMVLATVDPVVGKKKAQDFTLIDIEGNPFTLSDYEGKVVLIDFFRLQPPCPPCIEEIPHLKGVYNEYSQSQVVIMSLSVSPSDTDDTLRENFVEKYDIPWIVACGASEFAHVEYGVQFIPTLVIIDTNGFYGDPHVGVTTQSALISEISILLSEDGASDTEKTLPPYLLIAIVGGAIIVSLVIAIVVAGLMLGWSKPSKRHLNKNKH